MAIQFGSKTAPKVTLLSKLLTELESACMEMKKLEEKHAAVFDSYSMLKDSKDALVERIKVEARKTVVPGETNTIMENSLGLITVVGVKPKLVIDYTAAVAAWPTRALRECSVTEIDNKRALHCLEVGSITQELFDQAASYKESTPAVTVKLNVGGK